MAIFDHWHPLLRSKDLKKRPVSVTLSGKDIVLFRCSNQGIGAVENKCSHRGMRLSEGWVENNCVICPYHGWSYSSSGEVISPTNPSLNHCTQFFETTEKYGLIWLKSAHSTPRLPEIDTEGYEYIGTSFHHVRAPLEITLDNFTEVEHTATAHEYFGYSREGTPKIEMTMEVTEDTVIVSNKGPQRTFPKLAEPFIEIRPGDWFFNTWVSYFSPVYTVYEQFWLSPDSQKQRRERLRIAIFFNPLNNEETQLVILAFSRRVVNRLIFEIVIKPILRDLFQREIDLDRKIIERIADKNINLSGMKLGRFDKPLLENRKRIERIYKGQIRN